MAEGVKHLALASMLAVCAQAHAQDYVDLSVRCTGGNAGRRFVRATGQLAPGDPRTLELATSGRTRIFRAYRGATITLVCSQGGETSEARRVHANFPHAIRLALPRDRPDEEPRPSSIPINIESVPPGATVFLDSTASPSLGTTPLANVRVPSGDHTFIFQLTNHEEVSLRVSVRRRRETFRVVLRALGVIEISAGNPGANGATARVDGRMVGQGPLGSMPVRVTDLQPGHHQVRVEREGYVPFERWVDVSGVQVARIAAMLERAAPDTGSILVSGPDGAPVFLDGTPRGVAPTVIDNVTVGAHAVEVRAPGEPPFLREVTVLAGQRATVAPLVAPPGGTVHVIASVPGATIRIDGAEVGFSPVVRQGVSAGLHLVEATAEGYDPATRTVSVEDGQRHMVTIQLWSPR